MPAMIHRIRNDTDSSVPVRLPDCYTRIAEIAYYKVEISDFELGHELNNWVQVKRVVWGKAATQFKAK